MAVSLPRYLALSVLGTVGTTTLPRFLEVIHEDVASHGIFIAKGERILSPFSQLELMDAGSGRVHIKFIYNNKFLAVRSQTDHRISAVANEPVEDQSAWSCTMFRVTTTKQSSGVRVTLEHVHLGHMVVAREPDRILQVDQAGGGASFDFAVHDISAVLALKLPPLFTFKDYHGNYGRLELDDAEHPWIRFLSTISDSVDTVYEILPIDVGSFRIRSLRNNRCWKVRSIDGTLSSHIDVNTSADLANLPADHRWSEGLFNIHRVDDNVVTISHSDSDSGTPLWVTSMGTAGNRMYARAHVAGNPPLPDERSRFVLEEGVKSRSIYNVRYNVLAARLLLGTPKSMSTQTFPNDTSLPQNFGRTFTYTETTSTHWSSTASATVSVSFTFKGKVPLVVEKSITIGAEVTLATEDGGEHTVSLSKEDRIDITVPPKSRVVVSRWESHGSYDIPYSYTQEDILYNGEKVVLEKHDGLAIGVANHDIFYNAVEEPLAPSAFGEKTREYIIVPTSSRIVPPPNDPNPCSACCHCPCRCH